MLSCFSHIQLSATLWVVVCQAPLFMGFSRQEYWSGGEPMEKELATYSNILAWRIPGMEELGGLPSMGSHRVGHD